MNDMRRVNRMKNVLISANNIYKTYSLDSIEVHALSNVSFEIYDGEYHAEHYRRNGHFDEGNSFL